MSPVHKRIAIWLLAALCAAGGTWWWFENMEQRWEATPVFRFEAKGLPVKAASLFLKKYGYQVTQHDTLTEVLAAGPTMQRGTLMLPMSSGSLTSAQTKQLLAWVAQGNTLITTPHTVNKSERFSRLLEDAADKNSDGDSAADPILTHFALSVDDRVCVECKARKQPTSEADDRDDGNESDEDNDAPEPDSASEPESESDGDQSQPDKNAPAVSSTKAPNNKAVRKRDSTLIQFPDYPYPLELSRNHTRLVRERELPLVQFADTGWDTVRVYQQGRGRVVIMTHAPFLDSELASFDHAEILLALVKLTGDKHLSIVRNTDMPKWYVALWHAYMLPLIGVFCLLMLGLWRTMPRFGSVLPEPHAERRSLMEHVEASGRWLWKIPGGRDLLLSSARSATTDVIHRRDPAMQRRSLDAQMEQIASSTGIAEALITSAFLHPAATTPITFTQQIHTLQQVRKHYEQSLR
jgi:hypothetical protein